MPGRHPAAQAQPMSSRRPRSAASRSTRSRLRSAHRPGRDVVAEGAHRPPLDLGPDPVPDGHPATHLGVQVGLGPTPVGLEETVNAVPGNDHRLHPGVDRARLLGQRRPADEEAGHLGQVVAGEPEPVKPARFGAVVREHHHPTGHPPQLAQSGERVGPVVHGGERHRGVERLVVEREAQRVRRHARRGAGRALRAHHRRRFHRDDVAVRRLVGAGARPDIQHRPRVAERGPDLRGDPRLGAPGDGVAVPDGVVQLPAGHVDALLSRRYIEAIHRHDMPGTLRRQLVHPGPGRELRSNPFDRRSRPTPSSHV